MKRQQSLHGGDKHKIKKLLHHFLPDLFYTPRGHLSDNEEEEDDGEDAGKDDTRDSTSDAKPEKEDAKAGSGEEKETRKLWHISKLKVICKHFFSSASP